MTTERNHAEMLIDTKGNIDYLFAHASTLEDLNSIAKCCVFPGDDPKYVSDIIKEYVLEKLRLASVEDAEKTVFMIGYIKALYDAAE